MSMSLSGSMSVPEFIEVEGWTSPSPVIEGWTSNPGYVFNPSPVVAPPPSEIADPFQEYKRATDEKIGILEKSLSEEQLVSQNRDKESKENVEFMVEKLVESSCKLKSLEEKMNEKTSYLDAVKDKRWRKIDQYLSVQKKERQEMKDEITLLKKGMVGKINSLEKVMLVEQKKLRDEMVEMKNEITLLKKDKACMMEKISSLEKSMTNIVNFSNRVHSRLENSLMTLEKKIPLPQLPLVQNEEKLKSLEKDVEELFELTTGTIQDNVFLKNHCGEKKADIIEKSKNEYEHQQRAYTNFKSHHTIFCEKYQRSEAEASHYVQEKCSYMISKKQNSIESMKTLMDVELQGHLDAVDEAKEKFEECQKFFSN
jgi:hypothetical protein